MPAANTFSVESEEFEEFGDPTIELQEYTEISVEIEAIPTTIVFFNIA
ncbi:hypothetical protein GCM10011516_28210 [Sphingobacterium cellulitidis]|uniref:Uncharacterized protein n=1 Tax=Sphingobacterium cellulitidis TaxID=1768011 RepID=A0A8H9G1J3_9SPHI|nr:hypothetical protein GCM10011516_28210 [Sphingobacterium soli]